MRTKRIDTLERKGFSLIELLVVIGIISLLLSIVTTGYSRVKTLAYRTACQANLKQLALAFRMYLDDNNDTMPDAANMPTVNVTKKPIYFYLNKHVSSQQKIFRCPGDKKKNYFDADGKSETYFDHEGTSYAFNMVLGGEKVSKSAFVKRVGEKQAWVMYDYRPFHLKSNWLYLDGCVGDKDRK